METKRPGLKVVCDEEEDETERRYNPRKRKRATTNEEDDDEQQGPSIQGLSIQRPHNKKSQQKKISSTALLTVTCGNKTGILDVQKLHRGEECIKSEGHWFAPYAFEDFAGRGLSRKWKTTILYEDKPLLSLFKNGSLTTKGYKNTRHKKKPIIHSSLSEMSDSSSEAESSRKSSDGVVQQEEGSGCNSSTGDEATTRAAACTDSLLMSETKQHAEIEIKMESAPATPDVTPGPLNQTKDTESTNNHDDNLGFSSVLLFTVADTAAVTDMTDDRKQTEETEHRVQSSRLSSVTGNVTGSTPTLLQHSIKEEDTTYDGYPTNNQSLLIEIIDTNSSHDATHLQDTKPDVGAPRTIQASDITQSSDMVEATSTRPHTSCDLDTLDLDQLRREKLKMQIRVLRLQEEYYTQKIKEPQK